MPNTLEQSILKEYRRIRKLQYSSYPETSTSDKRTYNKILKDSGIKVFLKTLLNVFNPDKTKKKYIVLGLREESFLTSLPRKNTLLIARNFREAFFAITKGYSFRYLGLAEYYLIRAYFENKPSLLQGLVKQLVVLVTSSKKSRFIFYFNDFAPLEVIFRIISNEGKRVFTVCVQHGVLLKTNQGFIQEGSLSDYFLANGHEQAEIAPKFLGEKVKIVNLGPAYELPLLKEKSSLEVILVSNGGADVDLKRSQLTNLILNKLSKKLEENLINYAIKLHPSDVILSYDVKEKIFLGTKNDVLSNNPKIFIGFVSSLLYEAHSIGHTSIEIKLRDESAKLNIQQLNTFVPDYSFYDDQLNSLCQKLSMIPFLKKKEVDEFYLLPLKERVSLSVSKIENSIMNKG
jgi:hypothetical protein